jgi:hypothetical protein
MCMGVARAGGISAIRLWKCVLMRAAQLLWLRSFCVGCDSLRGGGDDA